jgi:hypothetical protein
MSPFAFEQLLLNISPVLAETHKAFNFEEFRRVATSTPLVRPQASAFTSTNEEPND